MAHEEGNRNLNAMKYPVIASAFYERKNETHKKMYESVILSVT
jgi:hypothetical protein